MTSSSLPQARQNVRAPELVGRGWLNTDGPLALRDLRGRFVLLDFWTFCCVNCLHVLDELRPLEAKYADELVVVGVHSPKFVHEADPDALAAAVQRYRVEHPVLDDPELRTWQAYTARAWPTLVLVDPEGYVVAHYAGEGHVHAIDAMIGVLREEHRERGTLQPGDSPYVAPPAVPGELAFPAKALLLPDGRTVVADAGHDEVVVGEERFGGFHEPNGVCVLPDGTVLVADTVGHRVAALDGTTVVDGLNSPWDLAWHQGKVWIAMAGDHTLWTWDPATGEATHVGGTRNEGLLDGPLAEAWFAQPSGLASDGERLWVADAETSALRYVASAGSTGYEVRTAVGTGLFDFGFRDGAAEQALLQHPLGVSVLPDGSIAVADTYNGAVRRYDPATRELTTIAVDLAEPSGLHVDGDQLVVVESAAHRLTRVPLGASAHGEDFSHRTQRPPTDLAAGEVELVVEFVPPPGQKVDDRFGPPSQLLVTSTPDALIRSGAGRSTELTRRIVVDGAVGDGVLHVAARAASCDEAGGEGAACHLHQQDWGVPVRITADGAAVLRLPLGGSA